MSVDCRATGTAHLGTKSVASRSSFSILSCLFLAASESGVRPHGSTLPGLTSFGSSSTPGLLHAYLGQPTREVFGHVQCRLYSDLHCSVPAAPRDPVMPILGSPQERRSAMPNVGYFGIYVIPFKQHPDNPLMPIFGSPRERCSAVFGVGYVGIDVSSFKQ